MFVNLEGTHLVVRKIHDVISNGKEPPAEDGTEEHVLVSCTASSYFTPTEGLDRDKQSEEKR